jgi:transposase
VTSNVPRDDATKHCVKRKPLSLTQEQRDQLEALVARRRAPAGHVRRARIILLSADDVSGSEIAKRVGMSQEQVSRIRTRFLEGGVDALADRPKAGRKDHAVSVEVEHRILELALSPPPAGRSRWTTRLIGREVKLTSWTVSKILRKHNVKPHLLRTYKVSRDPAFAEKVRDVVGLYLNPPENAVVLSVDEKTQVQALERTQLPLPLRVGRAVRHTHDYKRHGVVDLYAALNVESGEVAHACTDSHTSADFLAFMKLVARRHRNVELHVILDNSSTHSTPEVKAWLAKHPRIHFHYTPTSASWLNQVEGFFGILSKQSLSLTNFPSKKALRDHIEMYIASWNEHPTPFIWTKPAEALIQSHRRMSDRISHAVH